MSAERLNGIVRRVFFANTETVWMAGVLATEDGEVKFSGKVVANVGDRLELHGEWTHHPKYGRQFTASDGRLKMNESPEALAHLLASDDRFKGLGPVRAKKVVQAAIELSSDGEVATGLEEHAAEIAARANCPLEIVESAAKVWNERRSYFDTLAQLCEQGWSNGQAQKIFNKLGENAPTVVRQAPYSLIGKIAKFGFRTVDAIARQMGIASTDPMRLMAGVAYCLDQMGGNGNTWTTRDALLDEATQELKPDTLDAEEKILAALEELIRQGHVHVDVSPQGAEIVADARMASAEFDVFRMLLEGLEDVSDDIETGTISFSGERAGRVIETLNEGQKRAVWGVWSHRYSVISGGAGVGKTYTMRAVCEIAEENGLVVALCAPTGKAARKLTHATGRQAVTIHRLLEPTFNEQTGEFRFTRGPGKPIEMAVHETGAMLSMRAFYDRESKGEEMYGWRIKEVDLVVVDEVSMTDVRLMRYLLRALPDGCRLLLVGDHHQIPSVSPGAILRDLLSASDRYPGAVHILKEIVRQAGKLARNTSAILDGVVVGEEVDVWKINRTERGHEHDAAGLVAELVEKLVTEPVAPFEKPLDFAWDVQVLAPMYKTSLGVHALNTKLQQLRQRLLGNPPPDPVEINQRPKPLVGDRVIWTKNDYTLDLFNGTQAIITGQEKGGALNLFTEDGREVTIPAEKRSNIEVAYAITIHKSQGSEWPCVILCAATAHQYMHDRNLLYTGASRAAIALSLVGDMRGMRHFATEQKSASRQTFGAFLVQGWKPQASELVEAHKP